MIHKFSKEEFEQALFNIHPGYETRGMVAGEECYYIPVNENTRIQVRSSIGKDGFAKESGEDSIRTWLEIYKPVENHKYDWQSTGKKVDRLTQRVTGWPDRLKDKIRKLSNLGVTIRKAIEPCPTCSKPPWAAFSSSAKNPGRPYATCRACNYFTWLDTAPLKGSQVTLFELPKEEASESKTSKSEVLTFDDMVDDTPIHEWTPEQKAIFDFVKNEKGHGVVRGVAGCGKTSSNIEAMNYVDDFLDTVFLSFNRHIAHELRDRGVNGRTVNSLGNQIVAPLGEMDKWKVYDIVDRLYPGEEQKPTLVKINSLLKANLFDPTPDNIAKLSDIVDFGFDEANELAEMSRRILVEDWKSKSYNYNDQIYWPLKGRGQFPKFDFIGVDEAQDLDYSQICFIERCLASDGRILLIGDPMQAVYSFRGAYIGIMDMMQGKLEATVLPLSVSFRAPLAIVDRVNRRYPEIDFRAVPGAIEGSEISIDEWQLIDTIQDGDSVICRTNAPLVSPCFALIQRGIKATILGRDIGKSLISFIDKRSRLQRVTTIIDLIKDLHVYLGNEIPKLEAARKYQRIATLRDQIETIVAIADGCQSISQLRVKIENTFTEERKGVVFSTIHKFKGLEGPRIFWLDYNGKSHPKSDPGQNRRVNYVADTRTLDKLFLVYGEK